MLKKTIVRFLQLGSGDLVSKIIAFYTLTYIARVIGSGNLGKLAFAQAVVTYMLPITSAGMNVKGLNLVVANRSQVNGLVSDITLMRFTMALGMFGLFFLGVQMLTPGWEIKFIFIATASWMFVEALNTEYAYLGQGNMVAVSLMRAGIASLYLAVIYLLLKADGPIFMVPLWRGIVGCAVFLPAIFIICRGSFRVEPKRWPSLMKAGFPIMLSATFIQVYNYSDIVILNYWWPSNLLGWYNAAQRVTGIFIQGLLLLLAVFAPWFAERFSQADKDGLMQVHKFFRNLLAVTGIVVAFSLFISADFATNVLFGNDFTGTPQAIRWLSVSSLVIFLSTIYNYPLLFLGAEREYLRFIVIGGITIIVLNLLLAPRFGIPGAVMANITGNLVILSLSYLTLKKVMLKIGDAQLLGRRAQ